MNVRGEWRAMTLALVVAMTACAPMVAPYLGAVIVTVVFLASKPFTLRFDAATMLAIAIPGFAALSLIWSVNRAITLNGAITYAALGVMFIGVRHVIGSRRQLAIVAVGYLAGCVALVVRLVVMRVEQPLAARLNLLDVNANYAGYSFVAGFGVVVLLWATLRHKRYVTVALAVMSVLLVVGIVMAGTRGAFFGLAVLVAWLAASRLLRKPPLWAIASATALAALLITTGLSDRLVLAVETAVLRSSGEMSGRLQIWPSAREWWLEHFVIGSGASTLAVSNPMMIGAHSLILELGAGMGIVGVLLFVAFLWFTLRKQPALLVGSFIAVTAASYLTGHWELSPSAWVVLAMFSRAHLIEASSVPTGDDDSATVLADAAEPHPA